MTAEATSAPDIAVDAAAPTVDAVTTAVDAATSAPVADAITTSAHQAPAFAELFNTLGVNVVYLMGFSFILGSLFTILILVLLDFMRRNKQ